VGGAINGSWRSNPTHEISSRTLMGGVQARYGSIHERLQSTPRAASQKVATGRLSDKDEPSAP